MNRCVFLDRDGVLNYERGDYSWRLDHFKILPEVPASIRILKNSGYLLIVVTNQAGISKDLFERKDMEQCHQYLQEQCDHMIDAFYYSPYHPSVTESLSRKPGTLLFEKAIARYKIDVDRSWMLGDKERDLVPAKKLGISTIQIGEGPYITCADHQAKDIKEATAIITNIQG